MKHVKYLIIGAGISGLSTANELFFQGVSKDDILVLEADNEVGGLIRTDTIEGYTMEWGPEGLRGKTWNTKRIFDYIDKDPIPVNEEAKLRYIGKGNRIVKLPSNPINAITTPLIPFSGKLRTLKEPFVKKYEGDESVGEFVERRLGKHIVPLIDAFVTGVFGGDPHKLSIRHAFPMMKEMEVEYGRLIPGGMKYSKAKKERLRAEGKLLADNGEKDPFLLTSQDGMQGVVNAMAKNVNVMLSITVNKIKLDEKPIVIETDEMSFSCDYLIVATGINALQKIEIIDGENVVISPEILEARVMVVSLGFDLDSFEEDVKGYGFLIPDTEDRFIMGTLYSSRLFDFRAPKDKILLRCFIGGIRHQDRLEFSMDKIMENLLSDLNDYLGIKKQPSFVHSMLYENRGIPQLLQDHDKFLEWRDKRTLKHPNVFFTGIGWKGVSCDVLIEESIELAQKLVNRLN